jgi:hypothetical protein
MQVVIEHYRGRAARCSTCMSATWVMTLPAWLCAFGRTATHRGEGPGARRADHLADAE